MSETAAASRNLDLVEGWLEAEPIVDEVTASGFVLRRAGLAATNAAGTEVVGAAAEIGADPRARARFELLERIALLEAIDRSAARSGDAGPKTFEARDERGRRTGWIARAEVFPESDAPARYRPARSNGVALHVDFARAAERATWELIERDRVLRAWLGETRPESIPLEGEAARLGAATEHVFRAASFPAPPGASLASLEVAGVFGFPWSGRAPMVVGFAARPTRAAALDAAARECFQQLAFLDGEPIPADPPPLGPTAAHHIEHWLYPGHHAILAAWLDDGHGDAAVATPDASGPIVFVDLTPAELSGRFAVVKAISPAAIPLVFGAWPLARALPVERRVHPIG